MAVVVRLGAHHDGEMAVVGVCATPTDQRTPQVLQSTSGAARCWQRPGCDAYSTALAQHSTAQHSTAQHSTAQQLRRFLGDVMAAALDAHAERVITRTRAGIGNRQQSLAIVLQLQAACGTGTRSVCSGAIW